MEDKNIEVGNQSNLKSEARELSTLMVFNRNGHFAYIYKKTEKLVTAVYMITNFIKDNEPLKWQIRERALDLMSLNISFNTVSLSERRDLLKQYEALSLEIVSLSGIAHYSGLISEMNFKILSREFNSLVSIIEKDENKNLNEETVILAPGFFETETEKERGAEPTVPDPVLYKGQAVQPEPLEQKPVRVPIKDIHEKPVKTQDSKDDRQAIIVRILSKKGNLSVKDFTDALKGVSEKTVQRELLAMVASGVLKKEGERRWSTYSLVR